MASGPITSWQIEGKTMETVSDFIFLDSKITADSDCSHEIKGRLILGRKAMTNLDSTLKSRDTAVLTKVHLVKAMVFPAVMYGYEIRSDQISCSVMSDSLRPHESQHARPPCPSPTPGVHWDSRPSSQWCHPAISSSGVPFSSCPQSLPASGCFPMSQFFASGGQSTGVLALASFLPKKSQGWSPSEWIWELDCKESWALKNWCFWTVVL